ncbi:cathepsin L1-like [Anoplophora glabripennis]|uniref:cathepsin L1-like n=1 Tax=Anoplophora glabripennis TaxID=217634 RepID=UPI000873B5D3|nr:cathepsin L1-like [Anoplophora glabripennis]XP_018569741.1 cathepsin L1-like [Anoplophora glabripennis]
MNILYITLLVVLPFAFGVKEQEHWEKYKLEFKKSYDTVEEEQRKFNIFKDNLKMINAHNEKFKAGLTTYEMEVNKFADLTADEYTTKYKMFPSQTFIYNDTLPVANEIEHGEDNRTSEYLDWREKGAVTPAKNQGTCGACWIFSAIGVLEGLYFRKYNKLISFSEQNIVDCISNTSCLGGWPPRVLGYVEKHGITKEEEYPYQEKQGECRQDKFKSIKLPSIEILKIRDEEDALKEAVTKFGPVIVCVYASSKWMFYKSGVWYEKECSYNSNHAMVLVGYGRENGADYWLVKNSMGKDWGDNGFIKIARNKHRNYCGITGTAFYVI